MNVENSSNTADLANVALKDLATKGNAILVALDTTNIYTAQRTAFIAAYNAYITPDLA